MKTIAEIAKDLGVSRQSVYSRVKESGVNINDLTKEKIGKQTFFDEESVKIIMSACQKERVKEERVKVDDNTREAEFKRQIEQLTRELEEARAKISEDQAEIARLREIETEQRHTISSQAETIRIKTQQEAAKLLEAAPEERKGLWGRVKKLIGK
jgi:DNA-binding transcriptional regulator GbsR (MarR family)